MEKIEYLDFVSLMKKTKKYKDLLFTFEGKLAIFLSIIITVFMCLELPKMEIDNINSLIITMSVAFIIGMFTVIGFLLSGFAFVSGTISLKATENLYKKEKMDQLNSIFFSFYFTAVVIGIDILLWVLVLMAGIIDFPINLVSSIMLVFGVSYFTLFVIFYSIGLFETCINIFYLNYKFNKEE